MNKILLSAAAIALLFSSCAQNEIVNGPDQSTPDDGKIRFAASAGLNTKGTPINSTGDLQSITKEFTVSGYVGASPTALIDSRVVEWRDASKTWEYKTGDAPYWPNNSMTFMAFANWTTAPTVALLTGIVANGVTIPKDEVTEQKDLLVAITPNVNKELRTLMTFKHALTQIVFKSGKIGDKIDVRIGGVKIVNVAATGNMSFAPAANAKPIWTSGAQTADYAVNHIGATIGTSYFVQKIDDADINKYSKYPRVQTAPDPANNALMLIPQAFPAWNPTSGVLPTAQAGAYLEIDAVITQKDLLPTATDAIDYVYAGGITGGQFTFGKIYIPISSVVDEPSLWEAGKRINYILTFGDDNSGSGGGGYDENGNPTLIPIKFRAVVEDWTETDIPLLTSNINAASNAITHEFINGFANHLLFDVKAAPAPKLYAAKLTFTGATSASIAANLTAANDVAEVPFDGVFTTTNAGATNAQINAMFLPGSTLTFDFKTVNIDNGAPVISIPTGWKFVSGNPAVNGLVTINGAPKTLVIVKEPVAGYDFISLIGYLQETLEALEVNENGADPTSPACENVIVVNGAAVGDFKFSSEALAKLTTAPENSTVEIDFSNMTNFDVDNSVTTSVPAGWKATATGVTGTFYAGQAIKLTAAATLTFTKTNNGPAAIYRNVAALRAWLTAAPASTDVFYYDNVDFDVVIDDVTFDTGIGAAAAGAMVVLKYPVKTANVTGWTYSGGTFTKL